MAKINKCEEEQTQMAEFDWAYWYCLDGRHGHRGHVGHNDDAWETKAIAWDTKENAAFEAFELGLARLPYYYEHLGEEIAQKTDKLDSTLALALAANAAKALGVEDRVDARASQTMETRELAVLQYLDTSKWFDASVVNSFNQLLREQTWAANDWIETALRNNVELARIVATGNGKVAVA